MITATTASLVPRLCQRFAVLPFCTEGRAGLEVDVDVVVQLQRGYFGQHHLLKSTVSVVWHAGLVPASPSMSVVEAQRRKARAAHLSRPPPLVPSRRITGADREAIAVRAEDSVG